MDLQGPYLRCNLLRYRKLKVTEPRGNLRMKVTGRRGSAKFASVEALLSAQLNYPLLALLHARISGQP